MEDAIIIGLGLIFGLLLSYARLNRYDTISKLSIFKDFSVMKTIMLVMGIGGILLALEMSYGLASFQIKTLYVYAIALGGIFFGVGMSILGYCPGTLPISLGQGSIDAFIGIIGGILGGYFFSILHPYLGFLYSWDLGKESIFSMVGGEFSTHYFRVIGLISTLLVIGAFLLNILDRKMNGIDGYKWVVAGVGLSILNCLMFYKPFNRRPLGASSSYPYLGDKIFSATSCEYFEKIRTSGEWEIKFLIGALMAGFIYSLIGKCFEFRLIYSNWQKHKGSSKIKRIIWAFIGGILLIFGARLAGGCTSGHIISGGMQYGMSAYFFMFWTFLGFLVTGAVFYRK